MEMHLKLSPIHLQTDPRWRDETLGGSNERFGSTGCAVCGVSMALAEYDMAIPPDSLNRLMKAHSGYTDRGWIKWDAIADVTGGRAWVDASAPLSHATIDTALRRGRPVLAKVMINGSIAHWVLIAGKQGMEYLMKDPLGDGRSLEPIGRYRSRIHAIRVVHGDE